MGIKRKRSRKELWAAFDGIIHPEPSHRAIDPSNYSGTKLHRMVRTEYGKIKRPCDICGRITKRVYKVEFKERFMGDIKHGDSLPGNNPRWVWAPVCGKDCKLMFLFRYSWV
jgi:hypothetical protein